jgi:hypothetical protein
MQHEDTPPHHPAALAERPATGEGILRHIRATARARHAPRPNGTKHTLDQPLGSIDFCPISLGLVVDFSFLEWVAPRWKKIILP